MRNLKIINNKRVSTNRFSVLTIVFIATLMFSTAIPNGSAGNPELPVNLGSAGDFVILTKSGVSATGTTSVVGDIGVSPAAASYITGFGLIMDSSNEFATSSLITGRVYASDYAPPTPSKMTTAVSDMETAYTDAAGRTTPDYSELGTGEIGGLTLTPGLYKWSTGVTISTDVTITGSSSDVWIFQIAQDLDLANGKQVILSGGAKADNIYWQVAGQATLGTTSVLEGNVLCKTSIVLNTGATLNGRALAQTAITLDANAVNVPVTPETPIELDTTKPTVSSTVPHNSATDIEITRKISATFSEAMDPSTITTSTFTLKQGSTPVSGDVTYSGVKATFIPDDDLAHSTTYTATVTTSAEDLAGNGLDSDKVWSFTTNAAPEATGSQEKSQGESQRINTMNYTDMVPQGFQHQIERNQATMLQFNNTGLYMNCTNNMQVGVSAENQYTQKMLRIEIDSGNALQLQIQLRMSKPTDVTEPGKYMGFYCEIEPNATINQARLGMEIDPAQAQANNMEMEHLTWAYWNGENWVSVDSTLSDENVLEADIDHLSTWAIIQVEEAIELDTTKPTVSSTVPHNSATDIEITRKISATFSEAMDPSTITSSTFTLMDGSTPVSGTVTYSGVTATFTPDNDLAYDTTYTATVTTSAEDLAGNGLDSDKVWSFTTASAEGNAEPEPGGFPYWLLIPVIGVGAIVAILLFVKKPY